MSDYIIATASTSDLPRTWLEEHEVPFVSYQYSIAGEFFEDDCREESRAAIYVGMRNGDILTTSMINEYTYSDFFKSLLDTGKDVLFLDMSLKMSTSYENSLTAAEKMRSEYPDQQLYVMDTRCVSGGLGTLVYEAVRRKEAGMSFEEVVQWAEDNKFKVAHRFTVDDLNYLKVGGRVSNSSALVGTMLNIKPVLYVPDAGTLDVVKKVRGRKSSLKHIRDGIIHDLSRFDSTGTEIHILHADCAGDAEFVRDEVKAAHPQIGEVSITSLGVVIGAHCGPGLIAVFYLADGRYPD
ncbi:MAG: DegV family protein [Eggerthellaceae bacterium]|nr:DegV family protein [Eggerthellaceae bacterium]